MTDTRKDTAWIDDACAAWDAEAQEYCFKSHIYSDKLRALRTELAEAKAEIERLRGALGQCKENAAGAMMPSSVIHAIVDDALKGASQ